MKNVVKVFENIRDKSLGKNASASDKRVVNILSKEDLDPVFLFSDEELLYFKKIAKAFLYEHFIMFKEKLLEKPYITKHDLAELDLSAIKIPSYTKYTSGSSGVPTLVQKSFSCGDIHRIYTRHLYNKYGIYGLGDVVHIKRTDSKLIYDKYMGNKKEFSNIHVLDARTNIRIIANYTRHIAPSVIVCYPSILEEIIRIAEAPLDMFKDNLNYQIHKNDCSDILSSLIKVVTVGETVSKYLKLKLKEYKIDHLDTYSMEEAGYMLHSYSTFNDNEINRKYIESPFVELTICDDGSILVTDLFNYKTPVINYNTGDICCKKEHKAQNICAILGRTRNMMTLQDGSSVWPIYSSSKLLKFKSILGIQVVQQTSRRFDIIIKREHNCYDKELEEIADIIKKNINDLYGEGSENNYFTVYPIMNHANIIHHSQLKKEGFICCK